MIGLQNYHSVYSMVAKYIKDERLRQVFSFQPLLIGGNPFSTTSIYLLIHWLERKWGVFYPVGGTTALVNALVRLFKEHGENWFWTAPLKIFRLAMARSKVFCAADHVNFHATF